MSIYNKKNVKLGLKSVPTIYVEKSHDIRKIIEENNKAYIKTVKNKPHKMVIIDGKKIEVDAGIASVIQVLNDKGYRTCVCCEGHYEETYDNYTPVWIGFLEGYLPPRPRISGYERHARQLQTQKYPAYWYGPRFSQCRPKRTSYRGRRNMPEIKIHFTKYKRDMKKRNIHEEHQRVLDELLKWAQELPKYNQGLSKRMEDWCHRPFGDIDFENGEWDNYYDIAEDLSVDLDREWEEKWRYKLEKQL